MRRWAITAALLVAVVFGALGVKFVQTYRQIEQRAEMDEARPADAILVLGAAVYPGERPSPALRARMAQAIALYRQGIAPVLIVSGGLGRWPPSEAEVMRRLAAAADIAADAIRLDENAYSTQDSIRNATALMAQEGWQDVVIVSDPFHIERALTMARDAGVQAYGSPAADSPTYRIPRQRRYYTLRETLALMWYEIIERGVTG